MKKIVPHSPFEYTFFDEVFAYRVNIGITIFVFATVLALTIAILTVNYQTIKAARANPVNALKYE